jgi:putative ABC transport system permease protein
MLDPRWRKTIRDLWQQKSRALLVVLSIGVGVFAVGALIRTHVVVTREMAAGYVAINPASATLITEPFEDDLVQTVRRMREVAQAEGRRSVTVRLQVGPDAWRNLRLFAIPDYSEMQVNLITLEQGAWPPPRREMLLERASPAFLGRDIGDVVLIETAAGTQRELRIAGIAYDPNQPSPMMMGTAYGYVTFETLEWLGEPRNFNELHFTVATNIDDEDHIWRVAESVQAQIEKSGRTVFSTLVPKPGRHPFDEFFQPIAYILEAIAFLTLFLSGFLVVNTIMAVLTQQVRQIGVMKAVGARARQVMFLYFGMVLIFGLLALLVAAPLGQLGARAGIDSLAAFANLNISNYQSSRRVVALEIALSLLVPLLAALYPIISGSRITVREAISSYGLQNDFGSSKIDRFLERVRGLPQPILLSLRNTFRRRVRLALTYATLSLAGAIFMAVMTTRASLNLTFEGLFNYWQYDVGITLARPYRAEEIAYEAAQVPGVTAVETWGFTTIRRIRDDETESSIIRFYAPPAETAMIEPTMLDGRWLLPGDTNAIVLNGDVLKDETDIRVGDEIVAKVRGRDSTWQVVGIVKGVPFTGPMAYANYPYFSRVAREVDRGSVVQIVTEQHSHEFQSEVARNLETHFKRRGLHISSLATTVEERERIALQLDFIVVFLLIVAVLLGVVGGIGLMGTMGINVLERTREIGVLRAIGASDGAILQIIIVEGVFIGLLSWISGAVMAWPLSYFLSSGMGVAITREPLTYTFSAGGVLLWLILVLLLSSLACYLPARAAARLTVREVLAYE